MAIDTHLHPPLPFANTRPPGTAPELPDGLDPPDADLFDADLSDADLSDLDTGVTSIAPDRPEPYPVEIVRSDRRKKTVEARLVNGVIELRIPGRMGVEEEEHWVAEMQARFQRKRAAEIIDLPGRAALLAARHDLPLPAQVRWVSNQRQRWGSCTVNDATIRLSDQMVGFPLWVVDYVLIHELAHLRHADHSPAFWEVVHRYPKTERAIGYLMAKAEVEH